MTLLMTKPSITQGKVSKNPEETGQTRPSYAAKAILFNDDVHTFDEVAVQLVKAIRCSLKRGFDLANLVHSRGSAVVYSGHLERCEAVAMVLEDIKLQVKVER